MDTHRGGWTLVYSYTFNDYSNFSSGRNAVTPRPNWPAQQANVPISTTPPLNESSLGAVEWNVWKDIGIEFMVKSNINDWVVCLPNGGSIVTNLAIHGNRSIICQNIKNMATNCADVVPKNIYWYPRGPSLTRSNRASTIYYYFEGDTRSSCPTHDPCGNRGQNHKKRVSNPGGQIYLR